MRQDYVDKNAGTVSRMMSPSVAATGVTASDSGMFSAARALGRFAAAEGSARVVAAAEQMESA
jgi:hypothetical protein